MIRKYSLPILFLLVVLNLIGVRLFNPQQFSPDAQKNALPALEGLNLHLLNKPLPDNALVLVIDDAPESLPLEHQKVLSIGKEDLFEPSTYRKIKQHKGPVAIWSAKLQTSASAWMVLAQMGLKDHLLLVNSTNEEAFKHQFLPDTSLAGKESGLFLFE